MINLRIANVSVLALLLAVPMGCLDAGDGNQKSTRSAESTRPNPNGQDDANGGGSDGATGGGTSQGNSGGGSGFGVEGEGEAEDPSGPVPPSEPGAERGDADEASGGGSTIDVGVGQGGAQDFGVFRRILEEGGLPLPETLDDMGFFAEHHTALPPADCGQAICLHGLLGVMGNLINGANCTMAQLAMNARVEDEQMERRPLNLAVVLDTSGSMRAAGKIEFVRQGLQLMLDNLEDEDVIHLVVYNSEARVVAQNVTIEGREELRATITNLGASGGTNLHDGLALGFDLVQRVQSADFQNRVILLSDGQPTVGITDTPSIQAMATGYTDEGIGLTTIGVGAESNPTLLRSLSELGSGNFYFLEDESAVEEVFIEELAYFVTPIATNLRLEILTGPAYELREVFGTRLWNTEGHTGIIEIPSVFVAHRQSDEDQDRGRRGGGSAILLEMLPQLNWEALDLGNEEAGSIAQLRLTFLPAGEIERQEQIVEIRFPHDPGTNLEDGFFVDAVAGGSEVGSEAVEKSFVMLNIFAGFRMASERVRLGDLNGALSVLMNLETGVAEWLGRNHDEDIEDDLAILRLYTRNLMQAGAGQADDEPIEEDPWPED